MPLLRKKVSNINFFIVGSNPSKEILDLECEDIKVLGFVDKVLPIMNQIKISVVPLRFGAGIKGKIGSAMAAGLPVISTSIGAEGMSTVDNENILIADTPEEFCDQINKLYFDSKLWNKISQKGLDLANENWGVEKGYENLANVLSSISFEIDKPNFPLKIYEE